jgi:HK97 family phage portal protein
MAQTQSKPRLRERISASLKAFFGGYDWVSSGDPGNRFSSWGSGRLKIAGTSVNWEFITGDLLQNSVAVACYKWIWQNFNQSRVMVQKRLSDGETEEVLNHPLITLLDMPNAYWDWQTLNAAIIHDLLADGNAFLVINRRGVLPSELNWVSYTRVMPDKSSHDPNAPFDQWRITKPDASYAYVPFGDVVHFRIGVDPNTPMLGFSPYKSLKRQQYVLDQATNYNANILRNMGAVGGLITPKDPDHTFDPQEVVDKLNSRTRGDSVGEMTALSVPVDLQYPEMTPQKMSLDMMQDRPESDICAVLGVPAQVCGAHVGRLSKTYANVKEAREIAWEETLIPLLNLIASTLTRQLLWQVVGSDSADQFVEFDIRDIRPLQPDLDALHLRARADWQANLIDRAAWKRIVGEIPLPEDVGVFYADVAGGAGNVLDVPSVASAKSIKGVSIKGVALERYNDDRIFTELGLLDNDPETV